MSAAASNLAEDFALSVDAERSERSQRFETDLNEIYYEELIANRRHKHIWKQASAAETSPRIACPRKLDIVQHFHLGVFELSTPRVLLGYKRPSLEQGGMDATDTSISIDQYPEIREQVRLWVYLSLEPRVELPRVQKRSPAPLGGVQSLNYIYRSSFNSVELRRNIERKIMKKINSWRAMRKTIWNRAVQKRLQNILQALEESMTFAQDEPTSPQLSQAFFP